MAQTQGEMPPGSQLDDCGVRGPFGKDGTGEGNLAEDTKLARPVAIKLRRHPYPFMPRAPPPPRLTVSPLICSGWRIWGGLSLFAK